MIAISYFGNQYFSSKGGIDLFFNGGYQINSYVIASAVFVFAKYFWNESDEKKSVVALGSYTFSIYCMHAIVLEKLINYTHASHIVELILLSVPTMIISAIIAMIISQVKKTWGRPSKV